MSAKRVIIQHKSRAWNGVHGMVGVIMKMILKCATAIGLVWASAAWADPIGIRLVEVSAPQINCGFDTSCSLTVEDTVSTFTTPGHLGDGRFIARVGRHAPETPGPYKSNNRAFTLPSLSYRVDLSGMTAGDKCVHQVYIPWESYRPQFDYDNDGRRTDTAFQITRGSLGDVKVEQAWLNDDVLIVRFEGQGVCVGQRSYPFGFAAHGTLRTSEDSSTRAWGYLRSPVTGDDANFRVDTIYSGPPLGD